jgi:hypothetical protein
MVARDAKRFVVQQDWKAGKIDDDNDHDDDDDRDQESRDTRSIFSNIFLTD